MSLVHALNGNREDVVSRNLTKLVSSAIYRVKPQMYEVDGWENTLVRTCL